LNRCHLFLVEQEDHRVGGFTAAEAVLPGVLRGRQGIFEKRSRVISPSEPRDFAPPKYFRALARSGTLLAGCWTSPSWFWI